MLQQLTLKNFGIIAHADLSLTTGFTVVTGETGAGKSLVVDALGLLLGKAGNEGLIKTGENEAFVEGVFLLAFIPDALRSFVDEDGVCIVQRQLVRGRPSLAKINHNTVPIKLLRESMSDVIQIVGQHDMFALFKPEDQLRLLDDWVQETEEGRATFTRYAMLYVTYRELQALLDVDDAAQTKWEREMEFLRFQIAELQTYHLDPDEEDQLLDKKHEMKRQYALSQLADTALGHLDRAVGHTLEATPLLHKMVDLAPDLEAALQQLHSIRVMTGDLQDVVAKALSGVSRVSDADFDAIEDRLNVLFKLKTKHRVGTTRELYEKFIAYQQELEVLARRQSDMTDAQARLADTELALRGVADDITQLRTAHARDISRRVVAVLKELQFLQSHFEIAVVPGRVLGAKGHDTVQFLLSVNPGEVPKPMEKTASGGELSRVFLALKTVFQGRHSVLVFDEVDTGIGGVTAGSVGRYLAKLANQGDRQVQVFCVTHLPQIAMQATAHVYVLKYQENSETKVRVQTLDATTTKQELQRMVGGNVVIQELL